MHVLTRTVTLIVCGLISPLWQATAQAVEAPSASDAREVQPLLAKHCYVCHGPDEAARQAHLRLDDPDNASRVIRSGELLRRILTENEDERMPPPGRPPLSVSERTVLEHWIAAGADWDQQPHWAFQVPTWPNIPELNSPTSAHNPVDAFVLAAMERRSKSGNSNEPSTAATGPRFTFAPEADRITLIRRVSYDLTGLPPTVDEVDAFVHDQSPDAYERLVERLLASPRYGERMATLWLDLARYADTNGYEQDNGRQMWAWRDWVVRALNQNMPYDQFTIEQLAGDRLPNATFDQRLATGLHRNHGLNFEGGSIAEESRWNYVCDRVNTTATIWLGLTFACARCHDHKYDPISQREYYAFAAFFNNVPEEGYAGEQGNAAPLVKLPDSQREQQLVEFERELAAMQRQLTAMETGHDEEREQWKLNLLTGRDQLPAPPDDASVYCSLDKEEDNQIWDHVDPSAAALVEGQAHWTPGRYGDALLLDGQTRVDLGERASFERDQPFSIGVWIRPASNAFGPIVAKVYYQGYDLCWFDGRIQLNLVNRWDNNLITVETKSKWAINEWHHVLATYDGSSQAAGISIYVDGDAQAVNVSNDSLSDSIVTDSTLQIGARSAATPEHFAGAIDDLRFFTRQLTALEGQLLARYETLQTDIRSGQVSPELHRILDDYYLKKIDPSYVQLIAQQSAAKMNRDRILAAWPTAMVMDEMPERRETKVLIRGRYDRLGESVEPNTPAVLLPLNGNGPPDRLTLARWLVDPSHPLTARVTVNRHWQIFFGIGLVATLDDFGIRGERPVDQQLLDWLALEFIRSGWDVKHMHRLIVTSRLYRQTTTDSSQDERLAWARQQRLRLPAEMIRDGALAAAGLLSQRMGGPSVMPYQPADLWSEFSFRSTYTAQEYEQSHGEDLYRRSLYTFWKRTCPPPAMQAFDAGERQECLVQRTCTNTPLQALVLMNDPTFVEAARVLAENAIREEGNDAARGIRHGFRQVLSRSPSDLELRILVELYDKSRESMRMHPEHARELLSVGEVAAATGDDIQLASMSVVIHAILVLDEAITRN